MFIAPAPPVNNDWAFGRRVFLKTDANNRHPATQAIRPVRTVGGGWYTWVKTLRKPMSLEGTVQNGVVVLDPGPAAGGRDPRRSRPADRDGAVYAQDSGSVRGAGLRR
jgi:hypothetical protein